MGLSQEKQKTQALLKIEESDEFVKSKRTTDKREADGILSKTLN